MVPGVQAQRDGRVLQKPFDFRFRLHMAVGMGMEHGGQPVRRRAAGHPLYVPAEGAPLAVAQITVQHRLPGFQVGVHGREQDDISGFREILEKRCDFINRPAQPVGWL